MILYIIWYIYVNFDILIQYRCKSIVKPYISYSIDWIANKYKKIALISKDISTGLRKTHLISICEKSIESDGSDGIGQ